MADESLFDFLHMEIVSHVYKEQQSSKGELDSKVCGINVGQVRPVWSRELHVLFLSPADQKRNECEARKIRLVSPG